MEQDGLDEEGEVWLVQQRVKGTIKQSLMGSSSSKDCRMEQKSTFSHRGLVSSILWEASWEASGAQREASETSRESSLEISCEESVSDILASFT